MKTHALGCIPLGHPDVEDALAYVAFPAPYARDGTPLKGTRGIRERAAVDRACRALSLVADYHAARTVRRRFEETQALCHGARDGESVELAAYCVGSLLALEDAARVAIVGRRVSA